MSRLCGLVAVLVVSLALTAGTATAAPSELGSISKATAPALAAKSPPRVGSKTLRKLARMPLRKMKPRRGTRARASMWYDAGRVYVTAHCMMDWLNVDQPLVKALTGYRTQWVAIKADYRNTYVQSLSDWYYGIATSWGEWLPLSGTNRFQNARTGEYSDAPSFLHKLLPPPSNVYFQVVWYSSTGIVHRFSSWLNSGDFFNCY